MPAAISIRSPVRGFRRAGLHFNATGGTTYWIMASSTCWAFAGSLDLSVYLAVAPQATLSFSSTGTVDLGGNATVSGTLGCTGTVTLGPFVSRTVGQSVGRLNSVTADFSTTVACGQAATWTALGQPTAGKFTGVPATVNATVGVCNIVGCAYSSATAVIKLKG